MIYNVEGQMSIYIKYNPRTKKDCINKTHGINF